MLGRLYPGRFKWHGAYLMSARKLPTKSISLLTLEKDMLVEYFLVRS
jgi:hypothetical protein